MKHALLAAILLILSECAILGQSGLRSKPKDVNGWTKASWGMTRDEITKAFPGTHPFEDVLESAPFKIGDDQFTAEFNFSKDSNSLQAVIISPAEKILLLDNLFQRLEIMLTQKYGPPTTRTDPALQNKESVSTSWAFPSTIISLNRLKTGGPPPEDFLSISYVKNPVRKGPDNL
jgi:hypothetical protein